MPKITIQVEEEERPFVECLLHIIQHLRTPYARIIVHHEDGKPKDIEVQERLRIADMHKRLKAGSGQ